MANSIVFQNNAEQLKSAVYGYNSTNNTYEPIQVNSDGQLKVTIGTINYVGTLNKVTRVGTLNKLAAIGTLNYVGTLNKLTAIGTLNKVTSVGTLNKLTAIGTLNKVTSVGTLNKLTAIGTLNKVTTIGTLNKVTSIGTLNKLAAIGTLNYVGTLNKLTAIGTLNKVTSVGTLNKLVAIGTLNNIVGTVKVNLVDRTFTATYQTLRVTAGTATYTELIDVSKYQDISWYIRNITTDNKATVTVQLAATPNKDLQNYPRVLMQETATVNVNPRIITSDYYLKYNAVRAILSSGSNQTVVIVFNGRY